MAHQIAKLLLEHADTFLKRTEAVETALRLGMPLHEIEEYLDWTASLRPQPSGRRAGRSAGRRKRAAQPCRFRPAAG